MGFTNTNLYISKKEIQIKKENILILAHNKQCLTIVVLVVKKQL
jgi:hypothetical protein